MNVFEFEKKKGGNPEYRSQWDFEKETFRYAIPSTYSEEPRKWKLIFKILLIITLSNCIGFGTLVLLSEACTKVILCLMGLTLLQIGLLIYFSKTCRTPASSWTLVIIQWLIIAVETIFLGGIKGMAPMTFSFVIIVLIIHLGMLPGLIVLFFTIVFAGVIGFLESQLLLPDLLTPSAITTHAYFIIGQSIVMMLVILLPATRSVNTNEQWYETAMKMSLVGVWEWNVITDELKIGCVFINQLGYPTNDFPETMNALLSLVHQDDLSYAHHALKEYTEERSEKLDIEFRVRAKDQSYQWYRCFSELRSSGNRGDTTVSGAFKNITKLKYAEVALLQCQGNLDKANLELDKFVYKASHDLRSPISSVLGLINLMRMEERKENLEELCAMQEKCMNRMDRFINDIVHYSMNNRVALEINRLDFAGIIQEVLEHVQYMDNYKHVRISTEIQSSLEYYGDDQRVKTILKNLISNAVKFADLTKADPFVIIRIYPSDNGVVMHVADSGRGIACNQLDKIFQMFYRGTKSEDGSGIGLYIAREAAQRLSGTIEVVSELYVGTEFIIHLPDLRTMASEDTQQSTDIYDPAHASFLTRNKR